MNIQNFHSCDKSSFIYSQILSDNIILTFKHGWQKVSKCDKSLSILLKPKYILVLFENLDSKLNENCLETKISD